MRNMKDKQIFFISNKLSKNYKDFLLLIRNLTIRQILLLIIVKTGFSQKYLSKDLELDEATIYYY